MKPIVVAAVSIVTLALIFYTVGVAAHQRSRRVTRTVAGFLSAGVLCDVAATACMVVAAGGFNLNAHGVLGYTALLGMLTETAMAWRHRLRHGPEAPVSDRMTLYSRLAYGYWLIAFVSGGLLVMAARRGAQAALLA